MARCTANRPDLPQREQGHDWQYMSGSSYGEGESKLIKTAWFICDCGATKHVDVVVQNGS